MRKTVAVVFAILMWSSLLTFAADNKAPATQESPQVKTKVGDTAPDFTLLAFDGKEMKKVSLSDYRGKRNVVVAFYVFAFTPG
jgi:cytochrome oxidase Cu insertion factor (SCO1/SenC/PrrC family)